MASAWQLLHSIHLFLLSLHAYLGVMTNVLTLLPFQVSFVEVHVYGHKKQFEGRAWRMV